MRNWMRIAFGILDIAGCAAGLVRLALLLGQPHSSPRLWLEAAIFSLFLLLGIVGGILLLLARRGALTCNSIFWLIQIPGFSSTAVTYQLSAMLSLAPWLRFAPLRGGLSWHLGPMLFLSVSKPYPVIISVNLVALVIFLASVTARGFQPSASSAAQ